MTSLTSTKSIPHKWNTTVNCLVFVDDVLLINHFKFEIGFYTINENPILNDIALDQIKIFFNVLMSNAIIIDKKDSDEDKIPSELKNNKFMIPGKGSDQTIACLVYLKLISILGDNLEIDHITISSDLGNDISYSIDQDSIELEALIPNKEDWWQDQNIKFQPWWNRADPATYDMLINRDEIYEGDFLWQELFKEEFEEANNYNSKPKSKFKLINGGRDEH